MCVLCAFVHVRACMRACICVREGERHSFLVKHTGLLPGYNLSSLVTKVRRRFFMWQLSGILQAQEIFV